MELQQKEQQSITVRSTQVFQTPQLSHSSSKHVFFTVFVRLFAKLPRPGDSDGTFAVFRVKLPPFTTSSSNKEEAENL